MSELETLFMFRFSRPGSAWIKNVQRVCRQIREWGGIQVAVEKELKDSEAWNLVGEALGPMVHNYPCLASFVSPAAECLEMFFFFTYPPICLL